MELTGGEAVQFGRTLTSYCRWLGFPLIYSSSKVSFGSMEIDVAVWARVPLTYGCCPFPPPSAVVVVMSIYCRILKVS